MLDVCLLGSGGMMPLPVPVPNGPDDPIQREQSAHRLRGGDPGRGKRKRMEF